MKEFIMNSRQTVQHALMCLEAFELHSTESLSSEDISHLQGIPRAQCHAILARLEAGGIVRRLGPDAYRLERPLGELTAFEILEALWAPVEKQPVFKLLFGPAQGPALKRTLRAAGRLVPLMVAEG
jgi:DNA-binding IscR family transcriptional regulator